MSLQWYVIHAYSNEEHKVKSSLLERIKRFGMEEKFGEILVPTEEVVEMRMARSGGASVSSFRATYWCK